MGTKQFQDSFFVLNLLFPPSISVADSSHLSDVTKFGWVFCNLTGRRRSGCQETQVQQTIFHCDLIKTVNKKRPGKIYRNTGNPYF